MKVKDFNELIIKYSNNDVPNLMRKLKYIKIERF